jgi:hypothetical protein
MAWTETTSKTLLSEQEQQKTLLSKQEQQYTIQNIDKQFDVEKND